MAEDQSTAIVRTCGKHGEHSDWAIRKPHGSHKTVEFRCRSCSRDEYHEHKKRAWYGAARERARLKVGTRRRTRNEYYRRHIAEDVSARYGPHVAQRYVEVCEASASGRNVSAASVLRAMLREAHPLAKAGWIERVMDLNRASDLPLLNVGWLCARCFVQSSDPAFFDIDHIVPRSVIRKRRVKIDRNQHQVFGGGRGNAQVLCPNCHRCKTMGIADWFECSVAA